MKLVIKNKFHGTKRTITTKSADYALRVARSMKPSDCKSRTTITDENGNAVYIANFGGVNEFFTP